MSGGIGISSIVMITMKKAWKKLKTLKKTRKQVLWTAVTLPGGHHRDRHRRRVRRPRDKRTGGEGRHAPGRFDLRGRGRVAEDVSAQQFGWDITVRRVSEELHLEVKGVPGTKPTVLLTHNEDATAGADPAWRLTVAT